ncbi:MAG TPA: hypothetical protein VMJ14_00720 [Burkholderiales bacterium]|nr:hypothetical protein [Burkholderiales bacterium]
MARPIGTVDSVTQPGDVAGKVVVAGSHGGIIAAYLGATAGAHALILNDAGLGKDRAGISGLFYLEAIGMAAAAVDCMSARIGDGADMMARGVISHANAFAAFCGVIAGQACREAAERLRRAAAPRAKPPFRGEARWRVADGPPEVWALDSIGKLEPADAGRILVIGSHGALHGGRRDSALPVDAAAAMFNDAGVGADRIGISRLPALGARGISAVAVDCMSARIGDGRSMWESGVILHMNAPAAALGATRGMAVQRFAAACMRNFTAAQNRR